MQEGIRINKYLASTGICSRREADKLIESKEVAVDGITAELGTVVYEGQVVTWRGQAVLPKEDKIYIALNKPLGITCTTDRRDPSNIIDFLGFKERIFPIGRLDKNSSGLILLTNDGDIVNKLLRAEYGHEKEYEVRVDHVIDEAFRARMEAGIPILNTVTLPCSVMVTGPHTFRIILKQGLNRQIRRMCEYLGYRVTRLRRTRFMNIGLGSLKPGQHRRLSAAEVNGLLAQVNQSNQNKQDNRNQ